MSCKALAVLTLYTSTSNYFWMLCQGIYLHTLIIVAVFVGEQQLFWYYVLGWGESGGSELSLSLTTLSLWCFSQSCFHLVISAAEGQADSNNVCRDNILFTIQHEALGLLAQLQSTRSYASEMDSFLSLEGWHLLAWHMSYMSPLLLTPCCWYCNWKLCGFSFLQLKIYTATCWPRWQPVSLD